MIVLLVHGLSRTRWSFFLLSRRLTASGHSPEYFSYSALAETHESVLARLLTNLRALAATESEVGLVGHSFGGCLLREAIAKTPALTVRQLVMLGTPNRVPRLAPAFYRYFPRRLIQGSCRECLIDSSWYEKLPALSVPYTIVAGTAGWRGRLSPFGDEINDGAVAVSETLVKDDDHPLLVPSLHTFLMNSRLVYQLIVEKLR
jgi:pimeloyl-ACP methyl ester carboxylesterase